MKGVASSENPQRIISQLCSSSGVVQYLPVHCYGFRPTARNFVLVHSHCSHQSCFPPQLEVVFSENALKFPSLASTKQREDNISCQLVNTGQHLAAEEPSISLRS